MADIDDEDLELEEEADADEEEVLANAIEANGEDEGLSAQ